MMTLAQALRSPSQPLTPFEYEITTLEPNDVTIEISHCGVCRGDLNALAASQDDAVFPRVPGHEIVGRVVEMGSAVTGLEINDRVGVGWQAGCCLTCEHCRAHQEHLCIDQSETCIKRFGGYANHIKVQSQFAIKIPDGLDSAEAAPFLCGGIASFSALERLHANSSKRAAIIGLGGVGHMATLFLGRLNCETHVFSSSRSKSEDAKTLGAARFVDLSESQALDLNKGLYDFVLLTSPADFNLKKLLNLLKPGGTLCLIGAGSSAFEFKSTDLIHEQKTIFGSCIGSPGLIGKMLTFVAENKIKPWIELLPLSKANIALERLAQNKTRYRTVLEMRG